MKRWIAIGVGTLLVGAAAVFLPPLRQMSQVGAGYVAKQMCSCLFVGGREWDACRADMLPEMDRIGAERLDDGTGVRASVPLLSERVARYTEGSGCTLYP